MYIYIYIHISDSIFMGGLNRPQILTTGHAKQQQQKGVDAATMNATYDLGGIRNDPVHLNQPALLGETRRQPPHSHLDSFTLIANEV